MTTAPPLSAGFMTMLELLASSLSAFCSSLEILLLPGLLGLHLAKSKINEKKNPKRRSVGGPLLTGV